VAGVFSSVAQKYDVMNDLMSMGLHRLWKRFPSLCTRACAPANGAGHRRRHRRHRPPAGPRKPARTGEVWLTDINGSMLGVGRDRMLDKGLMLPVAQCDAEKLPFPATTSTWSPSPSACAT
jgi:demethylmenaquinone methyltransferase/2-methoxy-6-polyprenyl-1,4-benzoquinol methylase